GVRTSSSGSSGCRTTPESRRDSAALLLTWLLGLLGIVYWRRAR
ncbi:MAG: MYXO-CTERM sorting domain-containing protein, partial [Planctomycetota bacterium]